MIIMKTKNIQTFLTAGHYFEGFLNQQVLAGNEFIRKVSPLRSESSNSSVSSERKVLITTGSGSVSSLLCNWDIGAAPEGYPLRQFPCFRGKHITPIYAPHIIVQINSRRELEICQRERGQHSKDKNLPALSYKEISFCAARRFSYYYFKYIVMYSWGRRSDVCCWLRAYVISKLICERAIFLPGKRTGNFYCGAACQPGAF